MTPTEVTTLLRQFNGWRRDFEDKFEQPDSHEVSEAIDAAVEMIERLEAAEKERVLDEQRIADLMGELNRVGHENDALRAKIEAMEQQKPVAWVRKLGLDLPSVGCVTDLKYRPSNIPESAYIPLYALPGAQNAPSVPTESIGKMLAQAMEAAVANGANSVSMPDELVEVAAWLSGVQPNPANGQNRAVRDVIAERRRQIETEGWTPEHDDEHGAGEMAAAAACYALNAAGCGCEVARNWPWDGSWWKPTTSRRDLVKAGALVLAEIERLDRAAAPKPEGE